MGLKKERRPFLLADGTVLAGSGSLGGGSGSAQYRVLTIDVSTLTSSTVSLPVNTIADYEAVEITGLLPTALDNGSGIGLEIAIPLNANLPNKKVIVNNYISGATGIAPPVLLYLFSDDYSVSSFSSGWATAEVTLQTNINPSLRIVSFPRWSAASMGGFLNDSTVLPPAFGTRLLSVGDMPRRIFTFQVNYTQNMTTTPFVSIPLYVSKGSLANPDTLILDYLSGNLSKTTAVTEVGIGTTPITSNVAMTNEMRNIATPGAGLTTDFTSRNSSLNGGDLYYADTNKSYMHGTVINPVAGSGGVYLNIRGGTGSTTFTGTIKLYGTKTGS